MSTLSVENRAPITLQPKFDPDLRARLSQYEIDDPTSGLTFTERLARENYWTLAYARRVVAEYKRFLELTVSAGHICCPSDAVDQAWHQHLVYTRSYWDDLCKNVLRFPLHHGPTRGGHQEQHRYHQLYAATLDSYRNLFDAEPPADIWPCGEERFQQSSQSIRVDQGKYWVIPKLTSRSAAMAGGTASIPAILAVTNPLDMAGAEFIPFFAVAAVIALVIGIGIRSYRSKLSALESQRAIAPCGWALTAMLTAGNARAVLAAVTRLREEERIEIEQGRLIATPVALSVGSLEYSTASSPLAPNATPASETNTNKEDKIFEQAVMDEIASNEKGILYADLVKRCRYQTKRIAVQLEDKGLTLSPSSRQMRQFAATAPLALVIILGVSKAWIGIQRDRPIGILVAMLIAASIAIVLLFKSVSWRTALGDHYLAELKHRFAKPASKFSEEAAWADENVEAKPKRMDHSPEIPMYAALYGVSVLSMISMDHHALFYRSLSSQARLSGTGTGDAGAGGCGGDVGGSDGGSGCGGGGCGGGCGGCGS